MAIIAPGNSAIHLTVFFDSIMVPHYFATAPLGIELILADELTELGATKVKAGRAGVRFFGTLETAYTACLWSRLANRILLPLDEFTAADPEQLYAGIRSIAWEAHFDAHASFAVDFASSRSRITHALFGAQKVKDAIVDRFRDTCGERPTVDLDRPEIRINVYLDKDIASVSLDLSGDSLHKRGYRTEGGKAPLKENLAAALLRRAGWREIAAQGGQFLDPMCGSGTLPIEAAWIAGDHAPGLLRVYYGFLTWKKHEAATWRRLLDEAHARRETGMKNLPLIVGHDIDRHAVRIAQENIERAGLRGMVRVEKKAVDEIRPQRDFGLALANPPYGERLGEQESLEPLYAQLGASLKEHFQGWKAGVFTGNPELAFKLGLRATRYHTLYNGALECRLFHFEINPERFLQTREGGPLSETQRLHRDLLRKARMVDITAGGAGMFANRLRKNLKNLGRWARQQKISCYRLYDADLPEYAVAVDLYQGEKLWVQVQEYAAPATVDPAKAEQRLVEVLAAVPAMLEIPVGQMFLKVRRRQKGTAQYEKQAEAGRFYEVREDGLRFWVNFEDYLDTGLFLDHRLTRRLVRELAPGRRFLNLFAYTGSATVYAIAGGAVASTTVDLSRTYLDWAKRNLELNRLNGPRHDLVQADCLEWLESAVRGRARFDLIFLDPPTFSTSKRMRDTLDIQRDHVPLIRRCMSLLAPGGVLLFSNNQRKFKLDIDALGDFSMKDITRRTIPKDFERNALIHHCWRIEREPGRNGQAREYPCVSTGSDVSDRADIVFLRSTRRLHYGHVAFHFADEGAGDG
jgi:23S rRNA (guanine2445-N2)-methyltransferase / 23S rRNA (guanine2069-N7)-methyltransferase